MGSGLAGLNHPWGLWGTGSVPGCLDLPPLQLMVCGGCGLWLVGFTREAVGSGLLSRKLLTEGGAAPVGSGGSVGNPENRRCGWGGWELRTAGWSEQAVCTLKPTRSDLGSRMPRGSCVNVLSCSAVSDSFRSHGR